VKVTLNIFWEAGRLMHEQGSPILLWPAPNPSWTSLAIPSLPRASPAHEALSFHSPLPQLSFRTCSAASAELHLASSPGGAPDNL